MMSRAEANGLFFNSIHKSEQVEWKFTDSQPNLASLMSYTFATNRDKFPALSAINLTNSTAQKSIDEE